MNDSVTLTSQNHLVLDGGVLLSTINTDSISYDDFLRTLWQAETFALTDPVSLTFRLLFILALNPGRVYSGRSWPAVIIMALFPPSARTNDSDLEGDVILHLVDEVDHLGCQDVALVQHARQLWAGDPVKREQWIQWVQWEGETFRISGG